MKNIKSTGLSLWWSKLYQIGLQFGACPAELIITDSKIPVTKILHKPFLALALPDRERKENNICQNSVILLLVEILQLNKSRSHPHRTNGNGVYGALLCKQVDLPCKKISPSECIVEALRGILLFGVVIII